MERVWALGRGLDLGKLTDQRQNPRTWGQPQSPGVLEFISIIPLDPRFLRVFVFLISALSF